MTRESFIEKHSPLFWYTPEAEKKNISDSLLVETILNEGTMQDIKELYDILTIQKVAKVFFAAKGRKKKNYYPEIHHFFSLALAPYKTPKNARRNSQHTTS